MSGLQLRERSIQVAQSLTAFGVRSGDSVGMCSLNRLEFAYALIGTLMCGATVSPVNVTYTKSKFIHVLMLYMQTAIINQLYSINN